MVIWGVRGQGRRRDAIARRHQKRRGRGAGVLPRPILEHQQVRRGVRHAPLHACVVMFRVAAALDARRAQPPGERLHGPTDFGALALATGRHLRFWWPRLAHGELSEPHWAQLAASSHRSKPLRRWAARTSAGHLSCSQARRWAASRWSDTKRACCNETPTWWSSVQTSWRVESTPHSRPLSTRMRTECQQAGSPPPPRGPASLRSTRRLFCLGGSCGRRPPRGREPKRSRPCSPKAYGQS
jgi:hypothetical protein